ncbi:MAG: vWA domain-containing protein [bacterium]
MSKRLWLGLSSMFIVFVMLLVGLTINGCSTTVNTTTTAASPPTGTTTIEVGSGGSATLTANTKTGACSIIVVDQNQNPINSTNYLNVNNITVEVWTVTTATQSASVGTLTYTGGSSGSAISYCLMLDRSGSMFNSSSTMPSLEAAASTFVDNTKSTDQGCVVNFDSTIKVDQTLTTDKTLLKNAITNESVSGGGTALYDAVVTSVNTVDAGSNARKAVIAMTDGEDSGASTNTLTSCIAAAKTLSIPVYTVLLGTSVNPTVLQQISTDTGGVYYSAATATDLAALYDKISSALSSSWTVDFTSPVTFTTGTTYYVRITVTYSGGITNSVVFTVTV